MPSNFILFNRIGGVMVSMLAASAVDRGFEPRSGQTKDYDIGMCCFSTKPAALKEYDTVGIAKWFVHENSWFGQLRHALSKYAKKNIPYWLSFRYIYDRISTIFRQIFKIRIAIAV